MMLSGRLLAANRLLAELFAVCEAAVLTFPPWSLPSLVPSLPRGTTEAAKVAEDPADVKFAEIPAARIAEDSTDADCAEIWAATFAEAVSFFVVELLRRSKIASISAAGRALPDC